MKKEKIKNKCLITISISFLLISTGLQLSTMLEKETPYEISYEYVNVKDMAQAKVTNKVEKEMVKEPITTSLVQLLSKNSLEEEKDNGELQEVEFQENPNHQEKSSPEAPPQVETPPPPVWHLPTEMGRITQNPHYGHAALDIISPRAQGETIFPVANGTISGIYRDGAGALIVTVLHDVDGKKYTSQYAHLSRYASGLFVGKPVTINDALGQMGTTGYSTGVHLHLSVMDCALFDPNDANCSNLNSYFYYSNRRINEGYLGLGSMMLVPGEWNSR